MKALFIDCANRTTKLIEKDWTLGEMQEAVGGYVELVSLSRKHGVLVDEEGLFKDHQVFFEIQGQTPNPLAGNGLVIGFDGDGEFGTLDGEVSAQVVPLVKFWTLAELKAKNWN